MDLLYFVLVFGFGVLIGAAIFFFRQKDMISKELKGLASDALRQSNETFLQLAKVTMEKFHDKSAYELEKKEKAVADLVGPVKEALLKFDGKIADLEKARTTAFVSLKEQIGSLVESERQLKLETGNLVKALRAPTVRGRWGEIQLRRVVELAGMLDHCDFYEQESRTFEEKRYRPDLVVKLPGGKNIIVDAKAPLEAYLDSIETTTEDSRQLKMKDHARQVRAHLSQLGRKSYWEQFSPTPEFVVLFLPGEIFFSAALEQDPSLIELGVDQGVILATPTTLIALLRAVAYGWKQERISQNAEEISALGSELYKRIADLSVHFTKLGKNIEQTVASYNKAVGTLESRVLVSARRFKELNVEGDKEIDHLDPVETTARLLTAQELEAVTEEHLGGSSNQV